MAYSELVKNLDHVRKYMRDFYVFGFKGREDYDGKNQRSYDDERRRIESWLGEYMGFRRTAEGKYHFISIDSRNVKHNPLYNAWRAKSFTSGDITLHFIVFDILTVASAPLSLGEILERVEGDYLSHFENPPIIDESTLRKKLKEYISEGLIVASREGKRTLYSLSRDYLPNNLCDALDFFSEVAPSGVIGAFLLDKREVANERGCAFSFKHHYITSAIDSGILCRLFDIMTKGAYAEITCQKSKQKIPSVNRVLPLQIFISTQNGRQYLMAWNFAGHRFSSYRIDYILDARELEVCSNVAEYKERFEACRAHMWGVLTKENVNKTSHIEFTVRIEPGEEHIYPRLMRECRCGSVDIIDESTYRFCADVYDIGELIPWIRTFICRITDLKMDDGDLLKRFWRDVDEMYEMYGIGGDGDAV